MTVPSVADAVEAGAGDAAAGAGDAAGELDAIG
jgi:hypothetical protein